MYLRPPRVDDLDEYVELRAKSRPFLEPWQADDPRGADPFSRATALRFLARARTRRRLRWLVCRGADERIVGAVSLSGIQRAPLFSAALGYWIGAPHARRGYMREALTLAIDHAFVTAGLHRLEALVLPENEPSNALLAVLGFTREGIARGFGCVGGRFRDHERWALLRDDWKRS